MKNELEIIEFIRERFFSADRGIIKGIGDDTAVLRPQDSPLLITTDMMVEGIHFDLSFITPSQIGYKLVARNVSDIFAMAGEPEFMLLNLCIPPDLGPAFIEELLEGIHKGVTKYGIRLVGGDFSSSPKGLFLSATLTGISPKPVFRSGAREGDYIYITGTIGDSACGLEILKQGVPIPSEIKLPLIKRHLTPEPSPLHKKIDSINAMIDISDGLSLDLWRLCRESGVGAIIYEERIPMSEEMIKASEILGVNPLQFALSGGEDYELLFTSGSSIKRDGITEIGMIIEEGLFILNKDGKKRPLIPEGYTHKITL